MAYKYSVVGGFIIPNAVKVITASAGLSWCLFYGYSKSMTSKYGVKPPERAMRFTTGSAMLMAGSLAFDVYDMNKDIARMRDMDKEELELALAKMRKMKAGKFPKPLALCMVATSMFWVGGLYSTARQLETIIGNEVEKVSVSD